jgi:D-3-phosphoglycerate dehydrogenase
MKATGRVLICDAIDQAGVHSLERAGLEVTYQPEITTEKLVDSVANYNILIVRSRTKITKTIIDLATSAKIIARVGVGLDNIDVVAAEERNIRVINAPEAAISAVSELVIGFMLCFSRNIIFADAETRKGNWMKKSLMGSELSGKYLGIVGVGSIGRNTARIAKALRMNLIGYDPLPINRDFIKEVGLIKTDLDTLIESSDFITCHVPLTAQTRYMFNSNRLSKMKSTAYIINTSRGGVIDENALYDALKEGKIAGAALDVFEIEPPVNRLLFELPNVICTPHIGAQTVEAQRLASTIIAEKIIHILNEVT